jgi:hypothetical protein
VSTQNPASVLSGEEAYEQAEKREQLRAAGLPVLTGRGEDLERAWQALGDEMERGRVVRAAADRRAARRAAACDEQRRTA